MLTSIATIIVLCLIFTVLVGIHEFGHFIAAKYFGVWVQEFAFGFGPRLFERKMGDTVYKINLIPLGGYVKLHGEKGSTNSPQFRREFEKLDDVKEDHIKQLSKQNNLDHIRDEEELRLKINSIKDVSEEDKALLWVYELGSERRMKDQTKYSNKPIWQRLVIVIAGVVMNFILAVIIYSFYLNMVDNKIIIPRIAEYDFIAQEKSEVLAAYNINNKESQDLYLEVDGQRIENNQEFVNKLIENEGKELEVQYYSNGKIKDSSVVMFDKETGIFRVDDIKPIILSVIEDSPAGKAGILPSDIIAKIDNKDITFANLRTILDEYTGQKVGLEVIREGETQIKEIELNPKGSEYVLGATFDINGIGFVPLYYVGYENSFVGGLLHSVNMLGYNIKSIGTIFSFAFTEKDPGIVVETLSGPVRVGAEINQLIKFGNFNDIINLTALISLTLAFMNILPLPVVDGGHVVLLIIEKLKGSPASDTFQGIYNLVGLVLVIGLSIVVTLKDVWQVFFQ